MQKSIKKNMLLNMIKNIFSIIFPLITFPYATRVLGPENIGKVNFSQSIVSYFALLAGFGISTYGVREIARVRDNVFERSKLSVEILLLNLFTTLCAYVVFGIVVSNVNKFIYYRTILIVLSISIFFTTVGIDWLYIAMEDYAYITVRSLIFQLISLVLLFILVRQSNDFINYAILIVISSVGSNILNFLHSRKYISIKSLKGCKLSIFKHFGSSFIFFITVISATLHTLLDQTMLGFIVGDVEVGYYAVAVKLTNIITALIVSVSAVLLPRLSYLAEKDDDEIKKLLKRIIEFLLIVTIPVSVGLYLESDQIVYLLFGKNYENSILILQVISPIIILVSLTNIIGNQFFVAIKKERWTLISVFVGLFFNIVMNYFFIKKMQGVGAAYATICSEFIVLLIQIVLFIKVINIKGIFQIIGYTMVNTFVMAIIVYILKQKIKLIPLNLFVSVIAGVVVYFILLYIEKNDLIYLLLKKEKKEGLN